jgi:hypothetical protein
VWHTLQLGTPAEVARTRLRLPQPEHLTIAWSLAVTP